MLLGAEHLLALIAARPIDRFSRHVAVAVTGPSFNWLDRFTGGAGHHLARVGQYLRAGQAAQHHHQQR
ncbi:hypothetical protein D3C75_1187060 [compost metagenome]